MWYELSTGRPGEKRIGYVESHDQALVGDKTLIFRMADEAMYWHMNKTSDNVKIERAMALHKMIRFITISLGSEGYLNFMGNEFGHPEWIDFPREGNHWSFFHCRRLWSLSDNPSLRYEALRNFDMAMIQLMRDEGLLAAGSPRPLWIDQKKKIVSFRKKDYVFLFNFHPSESYTGFELPIHEKGSFQVVMDTDEERFGGHARISHETVYESVSLRRSNQITGITIYSPCRTAMVLRKVRE
jgi:1,4-alpha-glucan branching enzyme